MHNGVAVKIEVEVPASEGTLEADARERLRKDLLEAAVLWVFQERRITAVEAQGHLGMTRIAFVELACRRVFPGSVKSPFRL